MTEKQETLLQKLERQARARKLDKHSEQSYDWFRKQVRAFGGQKTRDTLLQQARQTNKIRNRPRSGYMYTFVYDAKHKDKLPYWDAFPLILMVGPAPKGFYGLNLHYLPPKARAMLFDELLSISSDNRYNLRTKFLMSYQLLNSASKYKAFKPTFKHYLWSQMQSQFALIPAQHWEAALFMPTASFKGAVNSKVWSDSILKI